MPTADLTAAIFFGTTLPICVWVAWSDLKFMRIPNKAVLMLIGVYATIGFVMLPTDTYLWGYANLVVVLIIGFLINALGMVGAGDAKFAAAMAPFIPLSHVASVLYLFAAMLLVAFATHRISARIPAVRNATPDWVSWGEKKDFPMGLALTGTLSTYFILRMNGVI